MAFQYIPKDTILDRMNPLVKLTYVSFALIFALLVNEISDLAIMVLWILTATVWWLAGKVEMRSLGFLLSLMKWMVLFLMIVQGLTYRYGDQTTLLELFNLPAPALEGVNYGHITIGGILFGLLVSTRIIVVVTVLPIFTMTTSMSRLNAALAKIRVPQKMIFMLVTAMRFVPLVQESWQAIIDAQKIRAFDIEKANFFQKIRRAYIPIITPLLLLMFRKAMDLEVAINARAFGAQKERTYVEDIDFRAIDYAGFAAVFGIFATFVYLMFYHSDPIAAFMYGWIVVGWESLMVVVQSLGIDVFLQAVNGYLIAIPILGLYFGFFDQNLLLGYGGVFALLILVYVIYKIVRGKLSE